MSKSVTGRKLFTEVYAQLLKMHEPRYSNITLEFLGNNELRLSATREASGGTWEHTAVVNADSMYSVYTSAYAIWVSQGKSIQIHSENSPCES